MYQSVWNRVFLLATGMAFGWNLVHWPSIAPGRYRTIRLRVWLSLSFGLLSLVLLALTAPAAAVVGAFVFSLSALVAYAGNAKQISKLDRPVFPLTELVRQDKPDLAGQIGVLLVADLLPSAYTGPLPWARAFVAMADAGGLSPHWFVRPFAYGRVRRALGEGRVPVTQATIETLSHETSEALGKKFAVQLASSLTDGQIAAQLRDLGSRGVSQIIVAPLAPDEKLREVAQEAITASRVTQAGVRVRLAAPHAERLFPSAPEMLQALLDSSASPAQPEWSASALANLRQSILSRVRA